MKLTTEQDSYYGASEYTEDRGCGGNAPEKAGRGWSCGTFFAIGLAFFALLSLCTAFGI